MRTQIEEKTKKETDFCYIGISKVPTDLRKRLKELAALNGRTLSNQIVQILRQFVAQ